eukprot:2591863-Prymnesium_polylepis.1
MTREGFTDAAACDEFGEPLETACGHRFHAVCLMCRSSNLSVRFPGWALRRGAEGASALGWGFYGAEKNFGRAGQK